jgi:drug/metabolite transporter (DMT)-like permease
MVDPVAILAVLVIGIGFIIVVARFLESRANAQGPLFTKPPNQVTWVVALLFGLALIVGVYFTNLAAIRKIPIFVGERTLNEENNSGFT